MLEQTIKTTDRLRFWFFASFIYLSLIYSTSLHYAYLPESTIALTFYLHTGSHSLQKWFPDLGVVKELPIQYQENDFWKMTSFWEDSAYYLIQATAPDESIPPFRYRVLPVMMAKAISANRAWTIQKAFVVLNVLFTLSAALLFSWYLLRFFAFSQLLALLGGVLFVTMVANTRTIAFPMNEPASMFFAILLFIAVRMRHVSLFIISSLCGVASKEILVIASVMWIVENCRGKGWSQVIKCFTVALVPLLGFVAIRLVLGGAPVEVSYGYNVLRGEFPETARRLLRLPDLISLWERVFLAFSFLWFGLANLRKDAFLFRQSILIFIVIMAAFLLSTNITRVLGVLFPLVIPSFLLFFVRYEGNRLASVITDL